MKKRLGIDIDETIVYTLRNFLEWYNDKHNTSFEESNFASYRWWETLGCSKEQAYVEARRYIQQKTALLGQHMLIEFVEGAEQALDLLSRTYELYGITSRNDFWHPDTHQISSALYVEPDEGSFFPEIPIPDFDGEGLIFPGDRIYSSSTDGMSKAEICKTFGIDTLIDDDAAVAEDCAMHGIRVYAPERPWNRSVVRHPLVRRVSGWQELCDILSPIRAVLPDAERTHWAY